MTRITFQIVVPDFPLWDSFFTLLWHHVKIHWVHIFLSLLFIYLSRPHVIDSLSVVGLWIMFGSCFVRSPFLTVSPLSITYRQCYSISEFLCGKYWIYTQSTTTETFPVSEKRRIICWRQVSEGKVDKKKVLALYKYSDFDLKRVAFKMNGDSTEWLT